MKKELLILPALLLVYQSSAFALMPTYDAANALQLGKHFVELKRQYSVMKDTLSNARAHLENGKDMLSNGRDMLTNAQNHLKTAKDLVSSNSGHYDFGKLKNNLDLHRWSPDSWGDALKGHGGSNPSQYTKILNLYKERHKSVSVDNVKKGASESVVKDYELTKQVNEAAGAQSEYAFNEVNKSMQRIHELSQQIDKAENTKAAIDLNSRLVTELAYLQTHNLKTQALANQQMAQKQSLELSDKANSSKFLAFDDNY